MIFWYNCTMNELKHLGEFEAVLKQYRVSSTAQQTLQSTKLALLVAPTATGRNTIVRELLKTGDYHYIVSDTTRHPRVNDGQPEQNGHEYWFRTEEEVLNDLRNGAFLEAAIIHNQQVSGISIREIEQAHVEQKTAVTDIEIVGVQNIVAAKPDTIVLFVLPPSFEEWQARIKRRGAMESGEFRRRLESAEQEFAAALAHDYYRFVVNDTIDHAVEQINLLTSDGKHSDGEHQKARQLAQQLHEATKEYLEAN
jgi:guanylate kinase